MVPVKLSIHSSTWCFLIAVGEHPPPANRTNCQVTLLISCGEVSLLISCEEVVQQLAWAFLPVPWGSGQCGSQRGDTSSGCPGKEKLGRLVTKVPHFVSSWAALWGKKVETRKRRTLHFFCELPVHYSTWPCLLISGC